jgi:ketosteroid isomerase-like protein
MVDLQEIEAIKRLKYKYMRGVDEKDWDAVSETLAEDATCAYSGGKYAYDGREAIMKFLVESMQRNTFLSSHRLHQPEIDLTSDTTATGIWALEDTVIDLQFEITLRGAAFYRDEYVKIDGAWKIQHTGYERTFEEIESRKGNEGLALVQNRWADAD